MPDSDETFQESKDRRKSERYRIAGRASFQWKDGKGTSREQTGSLRDVSTTGIFIKTISPPPVGSEILIQLQFENLGQNPTASITTRGQVTRVEIGATTDQEAGFAAAAGRMSLHRVSGETDEEP